MGTTPPTVAIIGTGFGGIGAAIALQRAGIESFTIFDKADGVGGTWRDNTYPGAACDIPSHFYSFSFERRSGWTRAFAPQAEILGYLEQVVDDYGLRPHLRLGTEITRMVFDEARAVWVLSTASGDDHEAQVVISALGQLNRPAYPAIPGLDEFSGPAFHSARWDHDLDLADKRVGVIGNGASAVQFVPPTAEAAQALTVFQRTPNWIVPKPDKVFSERRKHVFRAFPALERSYRWLLYALLEIRFLAMRQNSKVGAVIEATGRKHLADQVKDRSLRDRLQPDYPAACKRVLISSDYYPALQRDDVSLVTDAIDRIDATGVVTADGTHHDLDVLIYGTGFTTTEFLAPMEVLGRDGVELDVAWKEGAEAYLGITVAGFPNLFLLYGPNTNLGHNSIIFMIEAQARYIAQCVTAIADRRLRWMDVRPDVMSRFNRSIQAAVEGSVWATGCDSWYKTASGKVTNNWPRPTFRYWWETRRAVLDDFELRAR